MDTNKVNQNATVYATTTLETDKIVDNINDRDKETLYHYASSPQEKERISIDKGRADAQDLIKNSNNIDLQVNYPEQEGQEQREKGHWEVKGKEVEKHREVSEQIFSKGDPYIEAKEVEDE
ncbi:25964_t:CDS:2, partial [Gigaspora margarita]